MREWQYQSVSRRAEFGPVARLVTHGLLRSASFSGEAPSPRRRPSLSLSSLSAGARRRPAVVSSVLVHVSPNKGREAIVLSLEAMGSALSQPSLFTPVLQLPSGPIRGRVFVLPSGSRCDAFLGIPYGAPRRFERATRAAKWSDTRDCVRFGPRCPQIDEHFTDFLAQSAVPDDEFECLNLNIFTASSRQDRKLRPVMVWIHGGGFTMHSAAHYGDVEICRNLCEKDVLVVTLNYRLGVFGFFTTGDEHAPGNLGLWDMTLALEWVRDNIELFGGDPQRVTLFGHSAGGCAVDQLALSPHSNNLFSQMIVMSGNAECDFATRTTAAQTEISLNFAKFLGFSAPSDEGEKKRDTSKEVVRFLLSQPVSHLKLGIRGRKGFESHGTLLFVPHVDGDFFPQPLNELREAMPRKRTIVGTTLFEGLYFTALSGIPHDSQALRDFVAASIAGWHLENPEAAVSRLSSMYLADVHSKEELVRQFAKLFGDVTLNNGSFEYAQKMSSLGHKTFFYSFDYYNPRGFGLLSFLLPFKAATHGSELRYVLGKGVISKFRPNEDDLHVLTITTNFFTNFAKFGDPNGVSGDGVWKPHSPDQPFMHLSIGLHPQMKDDYQERRAAVWREVRRDVPLPPPA